MKFLILFLVTFMVYNDVAMENIVIQVHQEVGSGCNNGDIDEGRNNGDIDEGRNNGDIDEDRNNGDIDEDDGTTTTLGPNTPVDTCEGKEPAVPGNEYSVGGGDDFELIFHYISKTKGDIGCSLADRPDPSMTKFRLDMRNCSGYGGFMWVDLNDNTGDWKWANGPAIEGYIDLSQLTAKCSLLYLQEGGYNYKAIPCDSPATYPYLCIKNH